MRACAIMTLDPKGIAVMTRDMELIRKVILEIQARKDAEFQPIEMEGYDHGTVIRHLELMSEAGLIVAHISRGYDQTVIRVKDLTWAGHDFAAALANENVWGKIKKSFSPADLAAMPLGILKELGLGLLSQWAKGQLGLP